MSVWFRSSRATVASVSGVPLSRLMIARRVQVMWSSHSLRMSMRRVIAFADRADDELTVMAVGAWAWFSAVPWPIAAPFETANAARALEKATSAVRAIGIGREARVVFISVFPSVG